MKLLAIVMTLGACTPAFCQQEKGKSETPARGVVQFQLVKTDGKNVLLVQEVRDPNKKPVEKQYTVAVPVTRQVIKDGKTVTVTEYIKETRTRLEVPTVRKTFQTNPIHVFRDHEGKVIKKLDLIGRLGMGGGKLVVQVPPNQKIPPAIKKLLSKDTIFLHHEVNKKE